MTTIDRFKIINILKRLDYNPEIQLIDSLNEKLLQMLQPDNAIEPMDPCNIIKVWLLIYSVLNVLMYALSVISPCVHIAFSGYSNHFTEIEKNSATVDNDSEYENELKLLTKSLIISIEPSKSETENKKKKEGCKIFVRSLPMTHPIFIQFNNVMIPIKSVLQFKEKESFQVNCVQSTFLNGVSSKNVQCVGNDKYKIDGLPVDVSAFNSCKKQIKLVQVIGKPCPRGNMVHMIFHTPLVNFELYASCYNMKTKSTIYGRYLLYGKAFGKFYF